MKFSTIGIAVGPALLDFGAGEDRGRPPAAMRWARGNDAAPGPFDSAPFRTAETCVRSVTHVTAGAVTLCINKHSSRREKRGVGLWSKEDWADG